MRHTLRRAAAAVLLLPPLLLALATPAAAHDRNHYGDRSHYGDRNHYGDRGSHGGRDSRDARDLPAAFTLSGDSGGSQFEGIDVARDRRTFYVTEITGGEIHRGRVGDPRTVVWLDGDDALADGRRTAVGIATDRSGRVYVAGGANRTAAGSSARAPDFWVYDDDRRMLAALRMPVQGTVFLNDVVVAPDGAAFVTDSVTPRIFRVARDHGTWRATVWADATRVIRQTGTFGLNGIELAPDGRSLVVAQSDTGVLWRFDLATARPTRIDTGNAVLTDADGLVVEQRTLVAVRNQPHVLTYLRLARDATSARLFAEVATDPQRIFTTADVVHRRLLLVDSQFDENPASRDSEVVVLPFRRCPDAGPGSSTCSGVASTPL
jgi:sugar lactone lactonase YvrE